MRKPILMSALVVIAALAFASIMASVVVALPPASFWQHQSAYEIAFGNAWRVVAASMIAYFCLAWLIARDSPRRLWWAGAAVALSVAIGVSRYVQSQLYGLTPNDPVTYSSAILAMAGIATAWYLYLRRPGASAPSRSKSSWIGRQATVTVCCRRWIRPRTARRSPARPRKV